MYLFTAVLLSSFSFAAMACPNLAGSYLQCRSQTSNESDTTDLIITQTTRNRVTTYTMTGRDDEGSATTLTLIADGVARTEKIQDEDSGLVFEVTTRTSCKGQTLETLMITKLQGQDLGSVTSRSSKRGGTLVTETTGQMMGQEIRHTVLCE